MFELLQPVLQYSIEISLFVRCIANIIILVFLLPLQIKEAGVKNGLGKLRKQLLAAGVILFITNNASLFFLYDAYQRNVPQQPINASLQILNAFAFLGLSIIARIIYTQQYTDEAKDFHTKIDKLERTAEKHKNK